MQEDLYKKFSEIIQIKNSGIKFERLRYKISDLNFNKFNSENYQRYKVINTQPSDTNIFRICKGYLIEDIAKTAEIFLRDIIIKFLEKIKKQTSFSNIVFSGGLFLNVAMNGHISEKKLFKNHFFNLAPADNGLSLGAIGFYLVKNKKKFFKNERYGLNPYLGPSFDTFDVMKIVNKFNLKYKKETRSSYAFNVAKNISKGKIVGIFDGRAEYGQRSLGNRSILADPRSKESKMRLNLLLKKRDWFMPFAPAIIDSDFDKWFHNQPKNYYMQITSRVKNKQLSKKIPSAVHVDGTSRTQYVSKKINKNFWNIINNFKKITKNPIVLNTSFNRHGISTISNPRQAIEHLLEGCIDLLYINGIKIENNRKAVKLKKIKIDYMNESELLKQENLKWLKRNKSLLNKKELKKFYFFLRKKFNR